MGSTPASPIHPTPWADSEEHTDQNDPDQFCMIEMVPLLPNGRQDSQFVTQIGGDRPLEAKPQTNAILSLKKSPVSRSL